MLTIWQAGTSHFDALAVFDKCPPLAFTAGGPKLSEGLVGLTRGIASFTSLAEFLFKLGILRGLKVLEAACCATTQEAL